MTRNGLYQQLLDSLYAVDGVDGVFLGRLAERLPFIPRVEDDVLAVFPCTIVSRLNYQIEWHERAIDEEQAEWGDEADVSELSLGYVRDLEADLADLREQLAEA